MRSAVVLICCFLPLSAANRWNIQFSYDKDNSSIEFHDLQCPSVQVCFAAAALVESGPNRQKVKGAVVSTKDSGAHWTIADVKEVPASLFFLNETAGWMVTDKGVWQTEDGAHTWRKGKNLKGVSRVWFVDASHGWAVGEPKAIFETLDGGKDWQPLAVADSVKGAPAATSYDWITFSGDHGLIVGSVLRMKRDALNPQYGRPSPSSGILIESFDRGKTWKAAPLQVSGVLSRVRFVNSESALGLVEYLGSAKVPAELFSMNTGSRESGPVFVEKEEVARDFVVLPGGDVIIAAVRRLGEMSDVPVPSKIDVFESKSLSDWMPERVDYRATAKQPILAAADEQNVWMATDTGVILKRQPAAP